MTAGKPWPADADVFGDELGRRLSLDSIRTRWKALVAAVGVTSLQMRDLRHEGANQYEETETPVSDVSQLLGHTNLTRTSRYLRNKRRRMAQLAVDRLDQARAKAAHARTDATAAAPTTAAETRPREESTSPSSRPN